MEETNWCDFGNVWICISRDQKTGEIKRRKHLSRNGDLLSHTLYHDKITEFKMWYNTGILRRHEFYNSLPHGRFREWYSNGKLGIDEFWEDGALNGERKTWREDGHRYIYEFYFNGKCVDPHFAINKKCEIQRLKRRLQPGKTFPMNVFLISDLAKLGVIQF